MKFDLSIKLHKNRDAENVFQKKNKDTYQVYVEAVGVEPVVAAIARNHVVGLWLPTEAKELWGRRQFPQR